MNGKPVLLFHDTSALINFHRAGLIAVLARLNPGGVHWVTSVRFECRRKEGLLGLHGLEAAAAAAPGTPLFPNEAGHRKVRELRALMASPGDHPDEHLGEAETIVVIEEQGANAVIITDDRRVAVFALRTASTWQVARLCFKKNLLNYGECLDIWDLYIDAGG